MTIKVLIIDDSAVMRETLTNILTSDSEIEVIATAADPIFAAPKIQNEHPDVIILDIETARMDGLTFLRRINNSDDPIPCVICSTMVAEGSKNALQAIKYGAAELIHRPSLGTKRFLNESKARICSAVKSAYNKTETIKKSVLRAKPALSKKMPPEAPVAATGKIVVIGAGTGGTEALKDFLTMLPSDAPALIIAQHMQESFAPDFANRLDALCKIRVKEAENGDAVIPGQALIAPGNSHTVLKRSGTQYSVEIKEEPLVSRYKPSADVLFRSAAHSAGKNAVGIIMTGLGNDGAAGIKELHDAGAFTIAQDKSSCLVYEMPCEAVKTGGVDAIVPLGDIAKTMLSAASGQNAK